MRFNKHLSVVFSVLLFLLSFLIKGQDDQLEYLGVSNGLSQGMIIHMIQDRDGLIWMATKDGLNRYDGYEFKVYSHSPEDPYSVADHTQQFIFEDSRGWIWIGTERNGLDVYVKSQDRFYHFNSQSGSSKLLSNTIHVIAEDPDGNIWVGTEGGLDKIFIGREYDFTNKTSSVLNDEFKILNVAQVKSGITAMYFHHDTLYCGNYEKVYEKDSKAQVLTALPVDKISNNSEVYQSTTTQLYKDKFGHLWIFGPHSVTWFDGSESKHHFFPTNIRMPKAGVYIDTLRNEMIIGTSTLNKYQLREDGNLQSEEIANLGRLYCNNIIIDHSGIFWLGTNGFGLIKFNPDKRNFGHLIKGKSIYHIHEDRSGNVFLWYDHDLYQLDRQNNQIFKPKNIPKHLMKGRTVYQDRSGSYWFHVPQNVGNTELFEWNPITRRQTNYLYGHVPNNMSPIFEDQSRGIWIGTSDGKLLRFKKGSEEFTTIDLDRIPGLANAEFVTTSFVQDDEGLFWIGTTNGLLTFKYLDGLMLDFKLYQNKSNDHHSLSENYIMHVAIDEQKRNIIWLGTKGGGLNRFDKELNKFSRITTRDGLPNNVVYGILQDDDRLWLSTNRGLSVYSPNEGTIFSYTSKEGLQEDEFNSYAFCKTMDSTLIFGGVNGINMFRPDDIVPNTVKPNIIITQIQVNNQLYPMPLISGNDLEIPRIALGHRENLLTFQFSSLDYTAPDKNQYRYKLSGSSEDWIAVGNQNKVTFTNMKPGKYTFHVQGSNNSGLWSDATARIHFHIRPPWWLTTWAYLFYIVVVGLVLALLYRVQINRINLNSKLRFEQKETDRLIELDKLKTNFFSNITHEFRTPLTLIIEPIRQLISELKDNNQKSKLRLAEKNSTHLLHLVNQLLDLSKLEGGFMELELSVGDLTEVFRSSEDAFRPLAQQKQIDLIFKIPENPVFVEFDRSKFDLILNNLLSNAVKFTDQEGRIICSLEVERESEEEIQIKVQVTDTGVGIPPDLVDRIFDRFYQVDSTITRRTDGTGIGLSLTKELVSIMDGEIHVASTEDVGSEFTIIMVLQKGSQAMSRSVESLSHHLQTSNQDPLTTSTPSEQELMHSGQDIVLVVEDNEDLRHFICSSLWPHYRIIEAADGEDGIQKATEILPDLIISDLMMPRKNGYELCETLKENSLTSHIPIIMLTAKSAMDSKLKGLTKGADDYLTKPFHTEELLVRIHNLIASRRKLRAKYSHEQIHQDEASIAGDLMTPGDEAFIDELKSHIDAHIDQETFSVDDMAQLLFISRVQLYRKIKALTDMSPSEFVRNHRLDLAKKLLEENQGNVNEISMRVGIPNRSYFSRMFKERFGVLPSKIEGSSE